jgi:hypothetical protein
VVAVLGAVAACGGGNDGSGGSAASTTAAVGPVGPVATRPAPEGLPGVVAVPVAGADHVRGDVVYPTTPPAGGDHNAVWQNCGVYTTSITEEYAVHSLEHGAVWITYRGELDASVRDRLQQRARRDEHLLVSRLDDNPSPFVVTAWGRQLRLDAFDEAAITAFVDTYGVDGPTIPEKGAPCSGGIGRAPDQPLAR